MHIQFYLEKRHLIYIKLTFCNTTLKCQTPLYKCRCVGDKSSINGGIKYLKYCNKIEKTTIHFLTSTQKEYFCKKWLSFKNLLGV
jgi:hypothetical protein